MPTPTNSSTKMLWFWDGIKVTESRDIFIIDYDTFDSYNVNLLWSFIAGTVAGTLEQALVSISANGDCRADATFGQFVSDNTSCVTSAAVDKFTCTVSQQFSFDNQIHPIVIHTKLLPAMIERRRWSSSHWRSTSGSSYHSGDLDSCWNQQLHLR